MGLKQNKWDFAVGAYRSGDIESALKLFIQLARDGEPAAFREIGNIYENGGVNVDADYSKAIHWYERSFEDANDVEGCLGLARMYYFGKGVSTDYKKAYEYYSFLEHSNVPVALFQMAQMNYLGLGVDKDIDKAFNYYSKAASLGHIYSLKFLGSIELQKSHYLLGFLHSMKAIILLLVHRFYYSNENPRIRLF